jgi:hypothetical protein
VSGADGGDAVRMDGGGVIATHDRDGRLLVRLSSSVDGGGELEVHSPGSEGVARIGTTKSGSGEFVATNRKGHVVFGAGATFGGRGYVKSMSKDGQVAAQMGASVSGAGRVLTMDPEGRVQVELSVSPAGGGRVIANYGGSERVLIVAGEEAGSVDITDGDGFALVRAGGTIRGHGEVIVSGGRASARAELGITDSGRSGRVRTTGSGGRTVVQLDQTSAGHGQITTYNASRGVATVIGSSESGAGEIHTRSASDGLLVRIGSEQDRYGLVVGFGEGGRERVVFGGNGLQVMGASGRAVANLGRDTAGDGILVLHGNADESQATVYSGPTGGGIVLRDTAGAVVVRGSR